MADPELHVAYLTGEYPRATDTFIQREVAALRAAGIEVTTFAVRRPGSDHLTGPEQERAQATTTYLLELARGPALFTAHLRLAATAPGRYLRTLRLAWATRRHGLSGTLFQLFYLIEAVILADGLRRRGASHLHNHFADSSCTVAMLAAEAAGVPFSFTLHGSGIFFEARTWRLDAKIARAAFVACISHFTRSQAAIFAEPEALDRLHIVHCGVAPDGLQPVSHDGEGAELIFVGRVVEAKGLTVLFDAIERLRPRFPGVRLTVVGDGPDRVDLARRAEARGLGATIDFVGSRSQAEVAEFLAKADVFVLPSYAEGVPVVAMEALGSGLPAVVTMVGGMTELVEEDVTGLLVRPGDVDQLTDRLARLLGDPELRSRLGEAGRRRVVEHFDAASEAARLATLFANTATGVATGPVRPQLPAEAGEAAG